MSYDTDYFINQEEIDFLNFIAKATRSNQLFLTNAVQLNMVKLRPLYDWFESKLTVISPNSEFISIQRLADPGDVLSEHAIKLMRILGTGIDHFETVKLADIDSSLPKEALQKPSLILRSESFCLLHRLNFCANDCSGYF